MKGASLVGYSSIIIRRASLGTSTHMGATIYTTKNVQHNICSFQDQRGKVKNIHPCDLSRH